MTVSTLLLLIGFIIFIAILVWLAFEVIKYLPLPPPFGNILKALVILIVIIVFIEYGGPLLGVHLLH